MSTCRFQTTKLRREIVRACLITSVCSVQKKETSAANYLSFAAVVWKVKQIATLKEFNIDHTLSTFCVLKVLACKCTGVIMLLPILKKTNGAQQSQQI